MRCSLLPFIVIALALISQDARAEGENFELSLSGVVAEQLDPKSMISVSTIGTGNSPFVSLTTSLKSLPIQLPAAHFGGRAVYVHFYPPRRGKTLFSLELSPDLFKNPRKIELKLGKPEPTMEDAGFAGIRYYPVISEGVAYQRLPYWDKATGQLAPAPKPPALQTLLPSGKVVNEQEMGSFCMGFLWHASPDHYPDPDNGKSYVYKVTYDSGGLFEPIETTFQFNDEEYSLADEESEE